MVKEILIENQYGRTRAAVLEDGQLRELYTEQAGAEKLVGNIYLGRVENVLPGMQAAFVDIGLDRNAFLYAGDLNIGGDDPRFADIRDQAGSPHLIPIQKLVRNGQEMLVQVIKEPGGQKGPRISTHITLPGHLTVLLPTVDYVGVSRRIASDEKREQLRELITRIKPEGMGAIVRTAGEDADEDAFKADIEQLVKLWRLITERAKYIKPPRLIHRDEGIVYRAVRDMLTQEVSQVLIEDEGQYEYAVQTAELISPELTDRIKMHGSPMPLFPLHKVDEQAQRALQKRVWLKSGAYLIFDHTEAMTVIDVNTGKYVGNTGLQDTVLKVNIEAVKEIAHQLRLRDVGGIIVVDLIDMETPEQREQVLNALRTELKDDHTKTNLVGVTGLGMLEMTRKKMQQPIRNALTCTCPLCQGNGFISTPDTLAREALQTLRMRDAQGEQPVLIRVNQHVARALAVIGVNRAQPAYVLADDSVSQGDTEIESVASDKVPAQAQRLAPYREDCR